MVYAYAVAVWLVLLVLAILNGTLRAKVYQPRVGEQAGHVISTATFMVMIWAVVGVSLFLVPEVPPSPQLWAIGAGWAAVTVAFEFLFGHYVAGHSWARLLHDYNLFEGRLWVLVLLSILLSPPVLGAFV